MKRALLITVIATGFGLAGFSLWASLQVEAAHRQWVGMLEARPNLRVTETHFQRGWLDSIAQTRFELRGSAGETFQAPLEWAGRADVRKRVGFLVRQRIDHGPLGILAWFQEGAVGSPYLAVVDGSIELDQEAQSELSGAFGRLPAMRVRLPVRASGEALGQLSMPGGALRPRDVEPGEAPRWLGRFDGMNGHVRLAPGKAALQLRVPALELVGEELVVKAKGWELDVDLGRLDTVGGATSEHRVAHLQVEVGLEAESPDDGAPPQRTRLALEEARWTVAGELDEGRLEGHAKRLVWNLLDLAAPVLEANWPRPVAADDAATDGLFGFLREVEISRLAGDLTEGAFAARGTLRFPTGADAPSSLQPAQGTSDSWVHGALQLEVPEAFVARVMTGQEERVETWIGEGRIALMDGVLRTRLQWDASGWRANGQPLETTGWLERVAPTPRLARPTKPEPDPEELAETPADDAEPENTDDVPAETSPEAVAEAEDAPRLPTIFDEKPAAPVAPEAAASDTVRPTIFDEKPAAPVAPEAPADATAPSLPAAPAP